MTPPQPAPAADLKVPEALGHSEAFLDFLRRLSRAARVNRPVLIIGERGTGKELAAARLHALSPRWESPLVALNCAALAPSLIESELFGHEEGAFTGASKRRLGRFELAHQGTLFLDEIGNIPLEAQEKILRVVEYGSFERVGGTRLLQVDVRIVGATNADLTQLCAVGKFKQDLLDRLSFEVLIVPPLRERKEDIILLANFFATRMAFELGLAEVPDFTDEAEDALEAYYWPGNIRELKNVVERAVYRSPSATIAEIIFDPFAPFTEASSLILDANGSSIGSPVPIPVAPGPGMSFTTAIEDYEVELLRWALERSRQNQRKAAEILQLSYHQFRWFYRKHKAVLSGEADSQGDLTPQPPLPLGEGEDTPHSPQGRGGLGG